MNDRCFIEHSKCLHITLNNIHVNNDHTISLRIRQQKKRENFVLKTLRPVLGFDFFFIN